MTRKTLTLLFLCLLVAISGYAKAGDKHYTVVISLDGCRWDYPDWYDMPMMDYMEKHGVSSGLIPSFPSKTFPNHYTLATGLFPDHHGVLANSFKNRETGAIFNLKDSAQKHNPLYYGGEPIWLTAQRQGLRTAVFYWPGSDVAIQGQYPNTYYKYDVKRRLSLKQRIDGMLRQLAKPTGERPDLIMCYMEQPDGAGHKYGPHHRETRRQAIRVDSLIGFFYESLEHMHMKNQVNLIVVSDHGMAWVDESHVVNVKALLPQHWNAEIEGENPANIYVGEVYVDSVCEKLQGVDHIRAWKKQDIPAYLHYGTHANVGDVVVMPDVSYVVYDGPITAGGTHGYDPELMEMHALFRAMGPDIPHLSLPHFPNVCVYNLLCKLLNIEPASNDGYMPFELKQK